MLIPKEMIEKRSKSHNIEACFGGGNHVTIGRELDGEEDARENTGCT